LFFNLALVVVILYYLLYNPVKRFLKERTAKIAEQLDTAANEKESAETLRKQYETKIRDIDHERATILDDARKLAHDNAHRIITDAKAEAEAVKKRAELDIQRELEKAKEGMKSHLIEISTLMSSKFLTKALDEAEQNRLLDEAIAEIAALKGI
jgi:F-type H+-transporting ATPase subunit b